MLNVNLPAETPNTKPVPDRGKTRRWRYFGIPLVLLVLAVVATAVFYPQLPAETAVRFDFDGTPKVWLSRTATAALMIAPQLLFAMVAVTVAWAMSRLSNHLEIENAARRRLKYITLFLSNAVALPQFVIFFTLLDIFSYNAYQRHLVPMWLLLASLLGIITIVIGIAVTMIIREYRRQAAVPPTEKD
jgi:uncharacterized membrane protein